MKPEEEDLNRQEHSEPKTELEKLREMASGEERARQNGCGRLLNCTLMKIISM